MDNHETETLKKVYAAINRNDVPAIASWCDSSIVRIEPEGFPTAGTYHGIQEVIAHIQKGRGTWAEGTCSPERFQIFGNKVIAFLHVHVKLKDKADWIDARFPDGFEFKNGKITQMNSFVDDEHAFIWAKG